MFDPKKWYEPFLLRGKEVRSRQARFGGFPSGANGVVSSMSNSFKKEDKKFLNYYLLPTTYYLF
jgi:hypothetical protein